MTLRTPRPQRRFRWWSIPLGLLALVVLALLGAFLYLRSSLPKTRGTLTLPGLTAPVEVVRDRNAVPHIYAGSREDAYLALGFVHAQDRLFQMDFQRRVGAGWVSVRKAVVTSSYRFGLRAKRGGLYRYRVVAGANAGRAAATSGTLPLRVLRG